jgi:FkbM family methyltransferase
MLRDLGYPTGRALMLSAQSLPEYKALFRESGLRLMLYREHRDRADKFSECYFGRNYLPQPVECVVDVGAHVGTFAWACYKLLQPRTIFCYEPNADLIPQLTELALKMSKSEVSVKNSAVGERHADLRYHKTEATDLNSPLRFNEDERSLLQSYDAPLIQDVSVPQVTLDRELAALRQIDYLKIDTQGYEMSVLSGARRVLAKTRVVMIESNFLSIYAEGSTFCQVHRFLTDAGFLLVQLDSPSRSHGIYVWTDALYVSRALV